MKIALSLTAAVIAVVAASPAHAQAEKYLGEIFAFGGNFCPNGTMEANGALVPINQNTALFALFGTQYGGNGSTTFALPDMRARSFVGLGQQPGQSFINAGQAGGTETASVTLNQNQMPAHTHTARIRVAGGSIANTVSPVRGSFVATADNSYTNAPPTANYMNANTVEVLPVGGNQPVAIALRNPYIGMRHCVVTSGLFPQRP